MYECLITDFTNGIRIGTLVKKYKLTKDEVKNIIKDSGIKIERKYTKRVNGFVVNDWRVEKYKKHDGYKYIAVSKLDGTEFDDYMNVGGHLTKYIRDIVGVPTPTLYARRIYYQETGNYWWEQWFDIVEQEAAETKKCPYCDWETTDLENKSGAFKVHLRKCHGISINEYISKFPNEVSYFKNDERKRIKGEKLSKPENTVECPLCGNRYEKITISHIEKRHGINYERFKELYPTIKLMSDNMVTQANQAQKLGNLTVSKNRFISKYERELQDFLNQNDISFSANRQILDGKEIDLLIEDMKLGIEFNGLKWHTEFFGKKKHGYHLDKTITCNSHGYSLIQIFEDEYINKRDIVYSKIRHAIGLDNNNPKIMGRKCVVREIIKNEAMQFLEKYHIQGFVSSTVYLGAFHNNELVCVMSFKNGNIKNPNWELTRFAGMDCYRYQGVASKMFSYFIKNYSPGSVTSFADRRWTLDKDNNLYTKLGFEFDSFTRPDYKYYSDKLQNPDRYKRFHKMYFNKKKLIRKYGFPEVMTELEMARELGYDRIWDCGLIKYVWKNGEHAD